MSANGTMRVLVVDDEAGMREVVRLALEYLGAEAVEARDGLEALEILGQEKFDLVISDLRMPRMDGNELYRTVLECGIHPANRFLFMTGSLEMRRHLDRLRGEGAAFVFKPFHLDELITAVESLVGSAEGPTLSVRAA